MCGRIALFTPPGRLARLLDATLAAGLDPEGRPSWNVGPQRQLFGVSEQGATRVLDRYRWGLVPSWSKDPSMGNKMFNARSETVATKPSFRSAFKRQRLLIPVDGFYEWDRRGGAKVPHFFTRTDGAPIVLAGLYERWHDPAAAAETPSMQTCTVLTTTPGDDMDGIHDRMPVILEPETFEMWLAATDDELDALESLCRPAIRGTLVHHPVDARVGNVRNDGPELIEADAGSQLPGLA